MSNWWRLFAFLLCFLCHRCSLLMTLNMPCGFSLCGQGISPSGIQMICEILSKKWCFENCFHYNPVPIQPEGRQLLCLVVSLFYPSGWRFLVGNLQLDLPFVACCASSNIQTKSRYHLSSSTPLVDINWQQNFVLQQHSPSLWGFVCFSVQKYLVESQAINLKVPFAQITK